MFGDIERWLDDLTWRKCDFYFKYIASLIVLISKLYNKKSIIKDSDHTSTVCAKGGQY